MQTNLHAYLFALCLNKKAKTPLYAQLTTALRELIQNGKAPAGAQLPSTRIWAHELGVSRMTLTNALAQLAAEGYIDAHQGRGSFVSRNIPHLRPAKHISRKPDHSAPSPLPFSMHHPDLTHFPHATWSKYLASAWRKPDSALLRAADSFGFWSLRQAIAEHLLAWRNIQCPPEQIVITSGAQESYRILSHVMALQTRIVLEEPGFPLQHHVFAQSTHSIHRIDVDAEGIDAARAIDAKPGLMILSPTRHYPLGYVLSLERRRALLEYARQNDAWILEDDYDSEFRFEGRPLPALFSQSATENVIYMGSFSKIFSPHLRLGYLCLPYAMVGPVKSSITQFGTQASLVAQPALANFMQSGEFARHLRKMRRIYGGKYRALIEALRPYQALRVVGQAAGLHLTALLEHEKTDYAVAQRAAKMGITLQPISPLWRNQDHAKQGFLFGFAAYETQALCEAAARIGPLLNDSVSAKK